MKNKFFSFLAVRLKPFLSSEQELLNEYFYKNFHNGIANGFVAFPANFIGVKYIKVGNKFHSGAGLRLEALDNYQDITYSPKIQIGDNVCLNNNVHIGAINRIGIGDNVLIGSNVLITDHTHGCCSKEEIAIPPINRKLFSRGPVLIGNNVLIGENVCILPGVTIGSGAVIGAGAVVTRDIPENCIATGIPATCRIVK